LRDHEWVYVQFPALVLSNLLNFDKWKKWFDFQ